MFSVRRVSTDLFRERVFEDLRAPHSGDFLRLATNPTDLLASILSLLRNLCYNLLTGPSPEGSLLGPP